MDGQGNLERTWKVRGMSGNLLDDKDLARCGLLLKERICF